MRERAALFAAPIIAVLLFTPLALAHHIYLDRSRLPDLSPLVRFEAPTIGEVYDARGRVLIEVAREYRKTVSQEEVPPILCEAILAAEDRNFLSHSGVDYGALPRVLYKAAAATLTAWGNGSLRLVLPQGGSTVTQQLVRGYFLKERTRSERGDALYDEGLLSRFLSLVLGTRTTNKLARKVEELRMALWLEEEMRRHYGSREEAKRQILARYASFIYLGNGRYGYAAASEYYFGKSLASYTTEDAGRAALLAGIGKSPAEYAPAAGDPRPLRRRNAILALMGRNGSLPADLVARGQAEPVSVVTRTSEVETSAPAAIEHVFAELRERGQGRFGTEELFSGHISVHSTVDERVQAIVIEALERGLARYEKRRPKGKGSIQGSVVVLRNGDAAVLAEAGGRRVYQDRLARYYDFNRVTDSVRPAGSAMKPLVYLTAFGYGLDLDTTVPDEPIDVPMGAGHPVKWIANFDHQFKGPMPLRQALAESRNATVVWVVREIGPSTMIRTARDLGIRTSLPPYPSTALGASEVRLLELADVYRALASGVLAEPHVIARVTDAEGKVIYEPSRAARDVRSTGLTSKQLALIQEGLRGVVRLPGGTAHSLASRDFPIPVMGKTGTTSDCRDALFVGSTYGPQGITVAVRIGFDDNRPLGGSETGGRTALPVFREIMLRVYQQKLVGPVPKFPPEIEEGIDEYLAAQAALQESRQPPPLADPSPPPLSAPGL